MEFCLLGPVQARVAGEPVGLGARKQRFVLAVLALDVNTLVPVTRLVDLLWPDGPPPSARGMIQSYVSGLRSIVDRQRAAGIELVGGSGGYQLRCDPGRIDAHRFRDLAGRSRAAGDDQRRVQLLDEALRLWRGPALAGVAGEDVRARLARHLEDARLAAAEERADALLRLGRHGGLIDELTVLAEENPHRQRFAGQLMLALHRAGRTADALAGYQRTRRALADDLGIDPDAELRRLHQAILRGDPGLAAAAPAPGRPPAPALPRPAQLPADLATFTGRSAELDRLLALARAAPGGLPATVVISAIEGMAGVGKTALAVHAAHRLADGFADGQLFVDLHGFSAAVAPVRPAEALDRMLRSLGVPGGQIPAELDARAALLRSALAQRRMLVLLDNAADEAQVQPLLPGVRGCLVLITSRRRLAGLDDVQPLPLDVLPLADAVALFARIAARAELAAPPAELLAEVVELCGRLPLAIRIAAARLRDRPTWTVEDLAGRLRDHQHRLAELDAGNRSVTAAIDLSYRQLTADQRHLFRSLGLHPGPELDAYAAAALTGAPVRRARRLLDDLVDAHLLQESAPGRYRFHDLVRAHAGDTVLAEEGAGDRRAATGRLLDYYLAAAAAATDAAYPAHPADQDRRPRVPAPAGSLPPFPGLADALGWLDAELANLLAVTERAADDGWWSHPPRLSAVLHRHLRARAHYPAATAVHSRALQVARSAGDPAGELDALLDLGHVDRLTGRLQPAIEHFGQAVGVAREIGHRVGEMHALWGLGDAYRVTGRYAAAAEHYRQVAALAREVGHRAGQLDALAGLGDIHLVSGRHEEAIEHFGQALGVAREIGHQVGEMHALWGLGDTYRVTGRYPEAADYLQQTLVFSAGIGNRTGEVTALWGLGEVYRLTGRCEEAAEHHGRGLALAGELGMRVAEALALVGLGHVDRQAGRAAAAVEHYRQALAVTRETGDRNGEFEAWHGLGLAHQAAGRHADAVGCHESALALAVELQQRHDEARAHDGLAQAQHRLGRPDPARSHWQQALAIFADLGTPDAEAVRARLAQLDEEPGRGPG